MPLTLPPDYPPALLDAPFEGATTAAATFSTGFILPGMEVQEEEDFFEEEFAEDATADVLERAYFGTITTSRTSLYEVPAGSRSVIREIRLSNPTIADITVELWLAGLKIEPGYVVPAGEGRGQTFAGLMLEANETLEARASAAGLVVYAFAVEERGGSVLG